jgi:hypothetical protein
MPISAIVAMTSNGMVSGATRLFLNCCHGVNPEPFEAADSEGAFALVELALFINKAFDGSARNSYGAIKRWRQNNSNDRTTISIPAV